MDALAVKPPRSRLPDAMALLGVAALAGSAVAESIPDYFRDVAPVLRQYCLGCHNDADLEGDVTLERFSDFAANDWFADPLLKAGDPDGSYLIHLLTGKAEEAMPPKDEPQPRPADLELLRLWIAAGAPGPGDDARDVSVLSFLDVPELPPAKADPAITALALSPAGTRLAVASYGAVRLLPADPARRDVAPLPLDGVDGKINAVHFVPADPTRLISASGIAGLKGVATIWDLGSGEPVREFGADVHRDILYDAELSPEGAILATAGYDAKIALWNAATGELLRSIDGHNGAVFDLAFSPDGAVLASASADETVKLWKVATGERLDTLGQPQGEQFSVAFTPDARFIVAGGADNRIRLWRFVSTDTPRINPLLHARFAHEDAVVSLALSDDGRFLVSSGDDRAVKLWELPDLVPLQAWESQPDVVSALAIGGTGTIHAARMDGSLARLPFEAARPPAAVELATEESRPLPYFSRLVGSRLQRVIATESPEPQPVEVPAHITGTIDESMDVDDYRFTAKAGEQWILEVNAARSESPLDSVVEVLTADGEPIERVRLQAVRDSWFEFRGKDSTQSGDFRVFNWREMELNEYLYCNGEVVKLWLYPRGPDSGFTVYPGFGSRHTYFGTSGRTHALGEPCYIVTPLPPGSEPLANGLPVFPIHFRNDDDPQRRHGVDSKLTFTAPADGDFLARIRDVRGFGGPDYKYTLEIRPPKPDFKVSGGLGKDPVFFRDSGRDFELTAERHDGFDGEIRIDVTGLPPGFSASTPIVIEAGQHQAMGVISVAPDAPVPTGDLANAARLTATATIRDQTVTREVGPLGELKLNDEPAQLLVEIRPDGDSGTPRVNDDGILELTIRPGETITALVTAARNGFDGQIDFGKEDSGRNLAHGLIIDNIGLNGLMIPAGQHEQRFFITAAPWVPESSRSLHLRTGAAGHHATQPVLLHVRQP